MTNAERHTLVSRFRRAVYERYNFTPFAHQAEWQLAGDGWTLTDLPATAGAPSVFVLVPDPRHPSDPAKAKRERRLVVPRVGGAARVLADLAAYKAGKSYSMAAHATGYACVPDAKVEFVGLEYGTSEPEFNYLVEFLCSEKGMGMKYTSYQNDKRGGRMRLKLTTGAVYEVRSWTQKEALKGARIDAYYYTECLPLDAPIWMGDYTHKPIDEVEVGDTVIGWSKYLRSGRSGGRKLTAAGPRRALCRATVTGLVRKRDRLFKLTMASGRVVYSTAKHLWLSGSVQGRDAFVNPAVGRRLYRTIDVPRNLTYRELRTAAWLGGVYDGEGCRTFIGQEYPRNALVHEEIARRLEALGFHAVRERKGVRWNGGRQAALNFLIWTESLRYRAQYADEALLTSRCCEPDTIVEMKDCGIQDVACLTTTTENFVAYGYMSHNCYQLPGIECYTTVKQNLRQRDGVAVFGTTPDRPWVAILHDMGHGREPLWHCTCGVHGRVNPFTYDAHSEQLDDPERGGLMTRERYAIAWEGKLGSYVDSVFDYQRGQLQFSPATHPDLFDWDMLIADGLAERDPRVTHA